MSFQDDLLRNMQTKDEAEAAHNEEMMRIAAQHARFSFSQIKDALLSVANGGNYKIEDGKKIASCVLRFPDHCQHFLKLEDKSTYIPGTPSYMDRQLQEMMQASPKDRKAIAKKYRGLCLSGGGSPAQYNRCVCFSVDDTLNTECGCYIYKLLELAKAEDIIVEIGVCEKYSSDLYPIGVDIKDISTSHFDYVLCAKCSCIIPDTYSNDGTPIVITDTENNGISIDTMEGHQFEQFCAALLRKNGYSDVEVTRGSGDQGIDIIAYKDGVKFGVQCKCYSADIGNKAVQEAYSGKTYYNCHVGIVLTNRYFTRSAVDLAKSNGILLWDREYLLNLVKKAGIKIDE